MSRGAALIDQRIGSIVGQHSYPWSHSRPQFVADTGSVGKEVSNRLSRRRLPRHFAVGRLVAGSTRRPVGRFCSISSFSPIDRFGTSDQQQRVWRIERCDADFTLPCRQHVFVQLLTTASRPHCVGVLQFDHFDIGFRDFALLFDLLDHFHHALRRRVWLRE